MYCVKNKCDGGLQKQVCYRVHLLQSICSHDLCRMQIGDVNHEPEIYIHLAI